MSFCHILLLFAMITSLFSDSSNISLMDADVWFQPGFSDGEDFIRTSKGQLQFLIIQSFIKDGIMDNAGIFHSFTAYRAGVKLKAILIRHLSHLSAQNSAVLFGVA